MHASGIIGHLRNVAVEARKSKINEKLRQEAGLTAVLDQDTR